MVTSILVGGFDHPGEFFRGIPVMCALLIA
jgi:hypothetical protein